MSVHLLDVNALVALAWPNHVHHARALDWFRRSHRAGWATCPLTESGFVRVSSNAAVIPEARSPRAAILQLERMVSQDGHHFWHDDVSLARSPEAPREALMGHRQVTDAHLLALTRRRGGRIATFDGGLAELLNPADRSVVAMIP